MKTDTFRELLALLTQLREAKIDYSLRQSRDDALMIFVNVPGQRWEIEFVDYGDEVQIEIERFVSNGKIEGKTALVDLFTQFSDKPASSAGNSRTVGRRRPAGVSKR